MLISIHDQRTKFTTLQFT